MMDALTAIGQAKDTTDRYFTGAIDIFDNYYEGERNILDYPLILKVLMDTQQKDFEFSCKTGHVREFHTEEKWK